MEGSVIPSAVTLVVVCVVSVVDYNRFTIPNCVTIPFAFVGLTYNAISFGVQGLVFSVSGLIVGFGFLLIPYILGGFGGGDVKLLASMGAWLGVTGIAYVFLVSSLLLGLVSLVMLVRVQSVRRAAILNLRLTFGQFRFIGRLLGGQDRVEEIVTREDRRQRAVPFGVVLAIGLAIVLVWQLLASNSNLNLIL